eukprot:gnl/MRDRNA2_/MRDRNA2_31433_c0_seq1.p1 gnl/MRDRNA2_/MRDRNA2_31433_c0~~gnl/MRDRNA2_/MRDRNA2_31433_c0_seq1.p1  ORF type:complete len:209 (-),score=24.63 gnl/MRDRNA2_/MRDRNA2_31433_c0_seq1:719-1345(-)
MRRVDMIILLALVLQVHASELGTAGADYNPKAQESKDVDSQPLARNLLKQAPKVFPLRHDAVANTSLGKLSNPAISPSSIRAPRAFASLPTRAFARKPQFWGRGTPAQPAFNQAMMRKLLCPTSCARGSAIVKAGTNEQQAEYDKMVDENRMITVTESNIRYAGALAVFLGLVNSYVGMQATGVYDYSSIAAGAAGAFLLFESGRRSF